MRTSAPSWWARVERWAGWGAWIGLGIEAVLWFALSGISIENPLFFVGGLVVLVLGTWLCTALLIIRYRRFFGTWYGFAGLAAALALARCGQGVVVPDGFRELVLMGTLGLMAALPVSMVLLLRRRDLSATLIGLTLLAFVWVSLIVSVPYGGPIRAWLRYIATPDTGDFWWFETLTCLLMLALPLGSLAFILHLIRLAVKEIQSGR